MLQVFGKTPAMTSPSNPPLAAPGAGLPRMELAVARALFALRRWTGSREGFTRQFDKERTRIRRLVEKCDEAQLARRVLIRRLVGLEDSSRFWSVLMTLDHLRIVNTAIDDGVKKLTCGELPSGTASTAAVKPAEDVTVSVIGDYEMSCNSLLETIAAAGDLRTPLRYAHPWFGPLDSMGWYAIASMHIGIHRAQIERIMR